MRKAIAIFAVGSIGFAVVVAGCGGGGSDEAQQIDKATFVSRTNRICEQVSGKMAAGLASPANAAASDPTYVVTDVLIPGLEEELQKIRALGIPREAKKEVLAFLAASRKAIERAKSDPKGIVQSFTPFEAVEVAGTRFGVSECPIAPVSSG